MRLPAGVVFVALFCTCACDRPGLRELHKSLRHALDHTHLDVALSIIDQMGAMHPASLAHEARTHGSAMRGIQENLEFGYSTHPDERIAGASLELASIFGRVLSAVREQELQGQGHGQEQQQQQQEEQQQQQEEEDQHNEALTDQRRACRGRRRWRTSSGIGATASPPAGSGRKARCLGWDDTTASAGVL